MDLGETIQNASREIGARFRSLGTELKLTTEDSNEKVVFAVGLVMIALGALFLLRNLNLPWLHWLRFDILWPLLLVLIGVAMLIQRSRTK